MPRQRTSEPTRQLYAQIREDVYLAAKARAAETRVPLRIFLENALSDALGRDDAVEDSPPPPPPSVWDDEYLSMYHTAPAARGVAGGDDPDRGLRDRSRRGPQQSRLES